MLRPGVWSVEEATAYLRTNLPGKKSLSLATVRRWAGKKLIPANRCRDRRWYFEPELVVNWVNGGPILHEFYLAKNPRRALIQVRELIAYLCRPVNQEGNPFLEKHQEDLVSAVRTILCKSDYHKIRQSIRDLCETFRFNPGLACLEEVPGLFI
ncbi:MAG: hypothetical protein AAB486_03315 [Patescibacteria group bacterium]